MSFLLFAFVVGLAGVAVVLWRYRRPVSMESAIREFRQGLDALAPDPDWPGGPREPRAGEAAADPAPGIPPPGR